MAHITHTDETGRILAQSPSKEDDGTLFPADGSREAAIGAVSRLPTLGEALGAWEAQVAREQPADYDVAFKDLSLTPGGRLSKGNGGLQMTYRVFGTLLRRYCAAPRNTARVVHTLPVADQKSTHSPRACAYNAYLARGDKEHGEETVVLRTRRLAGSERPVIAGAVTTHHCREAGDDPVFIAGLREAFAEQGQALRATHFRGLEVSELRAVLPSQRVEVAPGEWWSAYLVVRNSEMGASSWSVSAGLVKEMDDAAFQAAQALGYEGSATLAVEANTRRGFHSGRKVPERLAEALAAAKEQLGSLVSQGATLAAREAKHNTEWVAQRLATALRRVGGGEELQEAMLGALAVAAAEWHEQENPSGAQRIRFPRPLTAHQVVSFLGLVMLHLRRRAQAYPLERLAGRVLLHGVDEALDKLPAVFDVEEEEE